MRRGVCAAKQIRHVQRAMAICGIDEAGRGPLAGPVVAAAVILPRKGRPKGLDDSKQLTAEARERTRDKNPRRRHCRRWAWPASKRSTRSTSCALRIWPCAAPSMRSAKQPVAAIVDGNMAPDLPCPVEWVIDGDVIVPIVSAASIIAKVERDRMMIELCAQFPGYAFSKHKGYARPSISAHLGDSARAPFIAAASSQCRMRCRVRSARQRRLGRRNHTDLERHLACHCRD